MSLENVSLSKEAITGASSKIFANALSDNLFKDNSGELDGGIIGNIFSSGVGSATNTIANNVMKGLVLTSGLGRNVGTSLASSGVGIGSNFIGQGIDSLGGHSMLSRGVGQGVATGLGTVGGLAVSNLIKYGTFAGKAANGSKAALIGKGAGSINPYGLAATVAGTALGAAFGPSKEYGGKYGSITQTMDTVYDGVTAAANFIPGWGQLASGFMTLNKGLSNIFGSTSGMTVQDAILGSAFMPAPVKWLNMANAKTTGGVNNYSWLNQEKLGGFMGDAFGDTWSKINKAVDESGKTYGTFSNSAYKKALGNINYVNSIYNPLLTMANQNEYQGIRAFDMDTINNLRYSQWIQGGFKPITVGKQGMKILNNATNHNMGMRLLSAAALIDNKAMILSAQGGTKVTRPPRMRAHRKGDESRGLTSEEQEWWKLHEEEQKRQLEEETARKIKEKEEAVDKFNQQTNTVIGAMTLQANETPFTGLDYLLAAEEQRQKRIEKFHEAEKVGEAALMADLAVSAAPLLLRGFRWAFNKAGLLVKVPVNKFTTAKSIYNEGNMTPTEVLQATGKGISDVYKTYSPGGAWYLRQLANGIPKEEVDKLASEYLKNLRKTTFEVTDSPLSDAVAVTGGEIRNGEIIPKITMDPKYAPNALLVRSAASHEGGHASTLNLEPKNSPYREPEHEGFYLLVEKENPETTKAMEYNESLRPNIKDSALDEVLLDETGSAERHINNVISSQEIRQRALASEIDASNKGVTMDEYISNPNLWDLNFKLLMEIFEESGIKNYMKNYKSIGLKGYPYYYDPITKQWDFSTASLDVKQGIKNLEEWMNNPEYRKAAEANRAEAESMGLSYIPYYERPEYIRSLENPNIKFKNLNSSVGGESNLSGEVTINTGTTLNPILVVRHEMGHVAGLGKISEAAAVNPNNTLLLKELKYLRYKSNQVYKEGSEYAGQVDLNRNSFEGIQNARDFGEELGIKIGQEYPGYEKALEIVNSYPENGFKAGLKKMFRLDKEHMPYVWKALAGTLFTLAATLYNTNK